MHLYTYPRFSLSHLRSHDRSHIPQHRTPSRLPPSNPGNGKSLNLRIPSISNLNPAFFMRHHGHARQRCPSSSRSIRTDPARISNTPSFFVYQIHAQVKERHSQLPASPTIILACPLRADTFGLPHPDTGKRGGEGHGQETRNCHGIIGTQRHSGSDMRCVAQCRRVQCRGRSGGQGDSGY